MTIRPLSLPDLDLALDLLQDGLREVPMYRWLIGDDAEPDAYRWYGEILFVEYLHGLRGIFDDAGVLIALIAVSDNTEESGRIDDDLKERTRRRIRELDGFPHRFNELQQKSAESTVADDPIRVIFVLIHPDHRGGGILAQLVDPVVARVHREGRPLTCSTSDAQLSDLYARRWSAFVRAQFTLTDGPTVWVQRIDPVG
ncbi:hypothetical protein [Gordonia sp. 'Campus']|uniref:hypothetical protein n=1 Tax=Gordonia sp. 'Campus' TaxID=2915824 RepID=UPI001EE3EC97|nr:hypothetical protein [Gordonia sp. 'Campus']